MMPSPRLRALTTLIVVIAAYAVGIGAWQWWINPPEPPIRLAGAVMIGGSGYASVAELGLGVEALDFDEGLSIDVAADGTGGLWLETRGDFVHIDADGKIDQDLPGSLHIFLPGGLDVDPDGGVVQGIQTRVIWWTTGSRQREVTHREYIEVEGFNVSSVSAASDGSLVASAYHEPRIVTIDDNGTMHPLLAPSTSPEPPQIPFDEPVRLTVVALRDGRIAFSTNAFQDSDGRGDGQLYLIDDGQLQHVDVDTTDPIRKIFRGPDDQLLALAGPTISLVDPDTGHVETLVDLSEIRAQLEPPAGAEFNDRPSCVVCGLSSEVRVSATAVGDDLVFLAKNRLWRLEDAF